MGSSRNRSYGAKQRRAHELEPVSRVNGRDRVLGTSEETSRIDHEGRHSTAESEQNILVTSQEEEREPHTILYGMGIHAR